MCLALSLLAVNWQAGKWSEIHLFWIRHSLIHQIKKDFKAPVSENRLDVSWPKHLFCPFAACWRFSSCDTSSWKAQCSLHHCRGKMRRKEKEKNKTQTCQKCSPACCWGGLGGLAAPRDQDVLPCPAQQETKKQPPAKSLLPQKPKPDQQSHVLHLALSFPLRKCHLLPSQI